MITYYGYTDGSGAFYVVINSDKCNGCRNCIKQCPKNLLQIASIFIDLDDKPVVAIKPEHCNNIKYLCAQCNPKQNQTPCITSCPTKAIKCISEPTNKNNHNNP
ncbi:MAG: 4Fe-4S binding protein [Nitrososphaerota archaeon]|nr:4Fe-4S binding protein [Nitrososphaerota archaeon]